MSVFIWFHRPSPFDAICARGGTMDTMTDRDCTEVRPTARHIINLQFDISANALEIRALQGPKSIA
jgi:hypothetical protein